MNQVNGINQDNNEMGKNSIKTNSIKVALYCRVSKQDQHPENQEIELNDYAKRNNFEVYKIYIDRISGAKASRPRLNDLLVDARKNQFKAVIVWKVDRLGRNVVHMGQIIQELQNLNIELIVTTLGIDTRTPVGKLVLGVLMQIAEFERELIRERINLGLGRRKKQLKNKGYFIKKGKKITKLGRPKGKKDNPSKPRRKSGYYQRWAKK